MAARDWTHPPAHRKTLAVVPLGGGKGLRARDVPTRVSHIF